MPGSFRPKAPSRHPWLPHPARASGRPVQAGPPHGYAIAQRQLSNQKLAVEEGSLYPALPRLLANGWVVGEWATSESGRRVRTYRLMRSGARELEMEAGQFERAAVIRTIVETARLR